MGGATPLTGRLEVCYNEVWGTVCDSNWADVDASVACRQLGFAPVGKKDQLTHTLTALSNSYYQFVAIIHLSIITVLI